MTDQPSTTLDDIVTPAELVAHYPRKFTRAQLTWMLRQRQVNGLAESGAVSLVGRKFYIDKPKFTSWLLSQKN